MDPERPPSGTAWTAGFSSSTGPGTPVLVIHGGVPHDLTTVVGFLSQASWVIATIDGSSMIPMLLQVNKP